LSLPAACARWPCKQRSSSIGTHPPENVEWICMPQIGRWKESNRRITLHEQLQLGVAPPPSRPLRDHPRRKDHPLLQQHPAALTVSKTKSRTENDAPYQRNMKKSSLLAPRRPCSNLMRPQCSRFLWKFSCEFLENLQIGNVIICLTFKKHLAVSYDRKRQKKILRFSR
jgi:hypothetical protein